MSTAKLFAFFRRCLLISLLAPAAYAANGWPDEETADTATHTAPAVPAPSAAPAASVPSSVESGVVKVFATVRYPDPFRPWTKQPPREISASGVVIEGKRILTNAHVVLYASQVEVQANQAGDKVSAKVVAIAPGIDLAVLKLEDDSFFKGHAPLARASALPQIKDAVLAYGFPTGGRALSITKGIVSRIEFVSYNYPTAGLRIQIDAAINPGNSGGPAIVNDKMIGLAYSHLGAAQNIGYIIPNEEIELFLQDIADGRYDGKAALYDDFQTLENDTIRAFLHLDRSVEGVVVRRPYQADSGYPLKPWDVVTRIADMPIDNEGMVKLGGDLRVNFQYLIQKAARDGKVPLTVVRAGKPLTVQLPVVARRPLLIPDLNGEYPPYFIYGPLVFSKATTQFRAFLSRNAIVMNVHSLIGSPLVTQFGLAPQADREELVVVSSPFFPHRLAKGYSNPGGNVVQSVNGVRIRSLRHLVSVLRDLNDEFVTFEFDRRIGETLVFPRKEMVKATEEILSDNDVRTQGSPDMLEVWRGSAGK